MKKGGRPRIIVTCDQLPGREFTIAEAAQLAGTAKNGVHAGLKRDAPVGKRRLRFRRSGKKVRDCAVEAPDARALKLTDALLFIQDATKEFPELLGMLSLMNGSG